MQIFMIMLYAGIVLAMEQETQKLSKKEQEEKFRRSLVRNKDRLSFEEIFQDDTDEQKIFLVEVRKLFIAGQ